MDYTVPGLLLTSLVAQTVKRLPTMRETRVQSLDQEDLLEKEMATHSSTLVWKIPWTEKPGSLQSMGSQRVGHDWVTSLSLSLSKTSRCFWPRKVWRNTSKWMRNCYHLSCHNFQWVKLWTCASKQFTLEHIHFLNVWCYNSIIINMKMSILI